jgi:hypothetical protein
MQRRRTRLHNAILLSGRVWSTLPTFVSDTLPRLPRTSIRRSLHHMLLRDLQSTKNEEAFRTRDVDSSSWYTNPDHDIIMSLGALRTKFPIRLALLHVRAHQDENREIENNSMSLSTNSLPRYSRISEQLTNLPSSTRYPPAAPIFGDAQLHHKPKKKHSRTNSLSTKSERTSKRATIGPTASMIPSTGMPINQQFLHTLIMSQPAFVIKLVHPHMPLPLTPSISLAPALDRQHNSKRLSAALLCLSILQLAIRPAFSGVTPSYYPLCLLWRYSNRLSNLPTIRSTVSCITPTDYAVCSALLYSVQRYHNRLLRASSRLCCVPCSALLCSVWRYYNRLSALFCLSILQPTIRRSTLPVDIATAYPLFSLRCYSILLSALLSLALLQPTIQSTDSPLYCLLHYSN